MYAKRIQITNYGPIDQLDITFPFEGDVPKPVILVGENGSGKSILLSHIVNGLISAKDSIYPDATEVETGKIYKLRSSYYIKSGREFYFARVDFENKLFIEEIRSVRRKKKDSDIPTGLSGTDALSAWNKMDLDKGDYFDSTFPETTPIVIPNQEKDKDKVEEIFSKNCVLYFPPNRFEDPAWLNEDNLKSKAQYMDIKKIEGYTNRRVIDYSPLHDNQNWLFDVIYDRAVFRGNSGNATSIYQIALQVVRSVMNGDQNIRFGIGGRLNRFVSIMENEKTLVPNIFQMSTGETALLNLFLSILRDFDLCSSSFTKTEDIRGIVVIDEIDLHLHAVHQYKILPKLIRMFPKVQFVLTTHSPLFVLGMKEFFGEDGFVLYRLSQGQPIDPEEFSEFANAYQAFTETSTLLDDIRKAVKDAQKPILFVEGITDEKYIRRAAKLFDQELMLENIEIRDNNGKSGLTNIWNGIEKLPSDLVPQRMVLLYDCDYEGKSENKGNIFKRKIPKQSSHPIKKGIENLFSKETLERACEYKPAFIDIDPERKKRRRGEMITVSEEWTVNKDEKTNLCDWLCENGIEEDFQCFSRIFDLLQEILEPNASLLDDQSPQVEQNGAEV